MIIRVLIAVVLAVPAYFYTMRYNIHMFQQNGYKNKEHLHWLKKKFRLQWILYFGLALGIVTCVFPYLALEIFEYLQDLEKGDAACPILPSARWKRH